MTRGGCSGAGQSTYSRVENIVRSVLPEDGVCDVCRILDILVSHNWTLTFWRDSMQSQLFDGWLCEMGRRNYTIEEEDVEKYPNATLWTIRSVTTVRVTSPTWKS